MVKGNHFKCQQEEPPRVDFTFPKPPSPTEFVRITLQLASGNKLFVMIHTIMHHSKVSVVLYILIMQLMSTSDLKSTVTALK